MRKHAWVPTSDKAIAFVAAVLVSWGGSSRSQPADFRVTKVVTDPPGRVQLEHQSETNSYYILYSGNSVTNIVVPSDLQLGAVESGTLNAPVLPASAGFFRVRRVSIQEPLDIDGDGLDDVYELRRSYFLNPLNPADARRDFDGDGCSNLQEYLQTSDPAVYDAASIVYVVDAPARPDEFRELSAAVDYLNQSLAPDAAGKVVILTERTQEIGTLSVIRILRVEAGSGYYGRATVGGLGGGAVTINALEPIQFDGVRWTNTISLVFNVGGDFRLLGNNLPVATSINVGGAGLAAAEAMAGPLRRKNSGTVNDIQIKSCSFSDVGIGLFGHIGAGTIIDTSNNNGSRLTLFGDAEFSGEMKAEMQLLDELTFKMSLAQSARLSVNQNLRLDSVNFEGRVEGTPTIKFEGNTMGTVDLKFLGAGHLTAYLNNNDVGGELRVEALEQADRRLDFSLGGSLRNAVSFKVYGDTTLLMADDIKVHAGAVFSLNGPRGDISAVRGDLAGQIVVETDSADIALAVRLANVTFTDDLKVSLPAVNVSLLIDLAKLFCGNSRISISGPKPENLEAGTRADPPAGPHRRKDGGGSSVTLRDIQLNSTGDKTVQIENLEVPVTIEGGTIANSGSLPNVVINQVKGPVVVRNVKFTGGGGIWVGNTESPVTIEDNKFQLSASGAALVGLNLAADNITIRGNEINGGGPNIAIAVAKPESSVTVANNTVKCGMGVSASVSQMQLQDNDFTTSGALSVSSGQTTATKNTFRGSISVNGESTALNLDNNQVIGTLNLGTGTATANNCNIQGSIMAGGGTLNLEGGELNGTLNVSAGSATARNTKFQGSIFIFGEGVLGLEGTQLGGVRIVDGNLNGGLKDDPVKQGANPDDVSSPVDFDGDPRHCADYPPPQYLDDAQTQCRRAGVPPPG